MKVCKGYVGIACVNGSCPKANAEEYAERDMDVVKSCSKCWYYEGCKDCAFFRVEEYCLIMKGDKK